MMLQVRFAEVNRRALTELGANFVVNRPDYLRSCDDAAVRRRQTSTTETSRRLVFSDFLNLFFFNRQEGCGVIVKALQSKGFFQSLAEPNLIAYNGRKPAFSPAAKFRFPSCRAPARIAP